jgi:asparagine synthase (glutamine-hydrolysing)
MSGIVGIFRPDGGPADQALVRALTRFLSFRGPDAREVWCGGPVALGHAMLRNTEEAAHERQPAGLDGRLWITADVRLDARDELSEALARAGRRPTRNAPDSELILHTYAAWGEECLQHLRGDFAFGIWDAKRKSLFCARDHFGIKPFYFAEQKDFFLFSNTLDCVRLHPEVSDDLNEAAIADFLMFGLNCDLATTTFRAIRRLPPAHSLHVSAEGLRIARYWTLPIDGRIRYAKADQYVDHFREVLREATSDRLRGGTVGMLLSGGLDSSSVAATTRELRPDNSKLRAYTVSYDGLILDPDPSYARHVADFLGVPIQILPMDTLQLFERWDDPDVRWPEPVNDPLMAGLFVQFQAIEADCRVAFDCEGADNLMRFRMGSYVRYLLRCGEWRRLCSDVPQYLYRTSIFRGAIRRARRFFEPKSGELDFPTWIDPDFARRVQAKQRWLNEGASSPTPAHPVVPAAHASLSVPQWQRLFELQNPGVTRCTVEVRYPFLDLRVVNFVLALPPFPWAFQKTLLRQAMEGRLPERIRRRPKSPLSSDPVAAALQRSNESWMAQTEWSDEIGRFVNRSALKTAQWGRNAEAAEMMLRPFCLNFWLRDARTIRYKLHAEVGNG